MGYTLIHADCFDWMKEQKPHSVTAIVTDPPYGVKEYSSKEVEKQRAGRGGLWRIPPSFDGHIRQAVPRFSVINDDPKERENVYQFFHQWAQEAIRILVPGGHVLIASTPLLSDILSRAMRDGGFERRGEIIRTVSTLRGGDRPKGAEQEFADLSVIPKGLWEPWGVYRKPLSERTVAENLKKWGAGALRREHVDAPVVDLIESTKTPQLERKIVAHPSLKPQKFLRKLVYSSLPLGCGVLFDPFAGSGSTLAAAEYFGYDSIGTERDLTFYNDAQRAIPKLAGLYPEQLEFNLQKVKKTESEEGRRTSFACAVDVV